MKPNVVDVYRNFCLTTDYDDIDQTYLGSETNYRLAFDKWVQDMDWKDIAGKISEEDWEQFKVEVDKFVTDYLAQHAYVKPIV